jgi:hypothetical protein
LKSESVSAKIGRPTEIKMRIDLAAEGEMSNEPKIEHDYDAGKDKLTITIHRYSLKSKKTRDAILEKLIANLESKPDRLIADEKEKLERDLRSFERWTF